MHNSAKTHQTLNKPNPLEFKQATQIIYWMIALCLQQHDTQLDTNLSSI